MILLRAEQSASYFAASRAEQALGKTVVGEAKPVSKSSRCFPAVQILNLVRNPFTMRGLQQLWQPGLLATQFLVKRAVSIVVLIGVATAA